METLVAEGIRKQDATLLQEVRFIVEQLQHKLQQDIHSHFYTGFAHQEALSSKIDHCVKMLDQLSTSVGSLQTHVSQQTSEHNQ